MNFADFKPKVQRTILSQTLKELDKNLIHLDDDSIECLGKSLTRTLDQLDQEDALGTEGWKHMLGIED